MGKSLKEAANNANPTRCFLLLEPRSLCDSGEIAQNLTKCRGVKEVHLTSGRYGFIVSARADSRNSVSRISSFVRKVSGSRTMSVAVSHFIFRR